MKFLGLGNVLLAGAIIASTSSISNLSPFRVQKVQAQTAKWYEYPKLRAFYSKYGAVVSEMNEKSLRENALALTFPNNALSENGFSERYKALPAVSLDERLSGLSANQKKYSPNFLAGSMRDFKSFANGSQTCERVTEILALGTSVEFDEIQARAQEYLALPPNQQKDFDRLWSSVRNNATGVQLVLIPEVKAGEYKIRVFVDRPPFNENKDGDMLLTIAYKNPKNNGLTAWFESFEKAEFYTQKMPDDVFKSLEGAMERANQVVFEHTSIEDAFTLFSIQYFPTKSCSPDFPGNA